MTVPQVGYFGLTGAVFAASTLSQNIGIAVSIVMLLVLLSTLLIRFASTIEKTTKSVIHRMQADGDLPTRLEREEITRTLEVLDQKMDRLLEGN